MNKQGQVGRFITGFVAFIIIVAVLIGFLAMTSGVVKNKGKSESEGYPFVEPRFDLLKEANFYDSKNNLIKHSLILDGWIEMYSKDYNLEDISFYFNYLLNEKNDCLIIFDEDKEADKSSIRATSYTSGSFWRYLKSKVSNFVPLNGVTFSIINGELMSGTFDVSVLSRKEYDSRAFDLVVLTMPVNKNLRTLYIQYYYGSCKGGGKLYG